MSRKRRVFNVDLPEEEVDLSMEVAAPAPSTAAVPPPVEEAAPAPVLRRGPMATAIGETGEALRRRAEVEADIRAENDALAHEFVRLKKLGLVVDRLPLAAIQCRKLVRDRSLTGDLELEDLKVSIRAIGLSNPIQVEPDGAGGYELVQGLRRLTAWREIYEETGDEAYATIPAGLMPAGTTMEVLYRRMVDENLIRKDVSFAEMAKLARAYVADGVEGCDDLDQAVNLLYASAAPQKRSYIRRFAWLMGVLEKYLEHAHAIPRALGLALADRLEAEPGASTGLIRQLRVIGRRSAEEELAVLRAFLDTAAAAAPLAAKPRGAPRGGQQRRGRMSLTVPVGGGVRCTATDGKLELRADLDFATLDPARLESAIAAFFEKLDKS